MPDRTAYTTIQARPARLFSCSGPAYSPASGTGAASVPSDRSERPGVEPRAVSRQHAPCPLTVELLNDRCCMGVSPDGHFSWAAAARPPARERHLSSRPRLGAAASSGRGGVPLWALECAKRT
jgi:hypothetical protein